MGRPPIGERAMTAAERQRLRRERLRQTAAPATDSADLIAARAEIERLRAELAAQHSRGRREPPPLPDTVEGMIAQRKAGEQRKAEERKAKRAAAAAAVPAEDEATLQDKLQRAEQLLKARQTRIQNLARQLA